MTKANFNGKSKKFEDSEFRPYYRIFDPIKSRNLTKECSVDPLWDEGNDTDIPNRFLVSFEEEDGHFEMRRFPYEPGELYRANFNVPGRMPYIQKMELKGSITEKLAFIMGFKPDMKDQEFDPSYYVFSYGGVRLGYEFVRKEYGNIRIIPRAFSVDEGNLEVGLGRELVKWGVDKKFPTSWLISHFPEVFGELAEDKEETLVDPLLVDPLLPEDNDAQKEEEPTDEEG